MIFLRICVLYIRVTCGVCWLLLNKFGKDSVGQKAASGSKINTLHVIVNKAFSTELLENIFVLVR